MAGGISASDIAAYQRDGAVLLKGVISADEVGLLRQGLEEAHAAPTRRYSKVSSADGAGATIVDQFASLQSPSLAALLAPGKVAGIAAALMQTASAQLVLDQMFYKEAGHIVPTPWHQDTPFLCVRGHDMARVWLTCDPSPANVTVQVVRGSHRWNVVYDTRSEAMLDVVTAVEGGEFTYDGIGDDRAPLAPDVERFRGSFDILSWDVEPGDAVVFNGNVLHGASGAKHHPHPRRAFATLWGGPDVRYHEPKGGAAMPTIGQFNGVAVRHGARIGDHPDAFPVFWPKAA